MDENIDQLITDAINRITEKLSQTLLEEFLQLSPNLKLNIILIKSAQLLLANILCQIALNEEELKKIADVQSAEMNELIYNCAFTGYSDKFNLIKH